VCRCAGKILIEKPNYSEDMRGSLLVMLILIIGSTHAARITVGPADEDYQQIQRAIDNSSKGDIIEVHSGTYPERVRVYKAVTLIGVDTGKGLPTVNASGSGSALTMKANGTTVKGFNLTGSGHCGCGNAGILVQSSNGTITDNVLYKNKYGIYVKPGYINNTFISNDLLDNEISASDQGGNRWYGSLKAQKAEGLQRLVELVAGKNLNGNHFSDYDEPKEGCNDTNNDGICDLPRKMDGSSSSEGPL
jgi:parallel beta-helix repeat protein